MREYVVTFYGRRRGAIGQFQDITIVVDADDRKHAMRVTGEEFEYNHIIDVRLSVTGQIMPPVSDSRQQPKSYAHKILEAHVRAKRSLSIADALRGRRSNIRRCHFDRDEHGGSVVRCAFTGRHFGYILPTVSDEVLAASPGIQSWSKPAPKPAVRWEHEGSLGDVYT